MSADDAWSASSNEALKISLVSPGATGLKTLASFHPQFTYPVFGDDEQIFGYQDLQINLRYNANDMRPNLAVSYRKKFKATGDTEAADIHEILDDFLPEVAFQKQKDFEAAISHIPDDWCPPGELISTFENKNGTFEVWKSNLADPAVAQLVKRIQIFVPLFIEGGTFIELDEPDDDRWTVFFLYQKKSVPAQPGRSSYVFAGYTTVYRYFFFKPPPTPPASPSPDDSEKELALDGEFDLLQLPCRSRISQFLVIPPFQGKGLGPNLYSVIFDEYIKHPQTLEITVEDPNEAFDDMRDIADLQYLRTMPEFNALRIDTSLAIPRDDGIAPNNIVDKKACEAVRTKAKMAPRQFARVLEMHLMSKLPGPCRPGFQPEVKSLIEPTKEEEHERQLWRLIVKKRIYQQNKDTLGQLHIPERIQKLNETVYSVEFDYARLLLKAEAQEKRLVTNGSNGKRKLDEEGEASVSKKARVEDDSAAESS
ncbi:acyl-CoA N-acyltransferase [Diplogelasinospora grovesii]|uniref:Histone acetyltransferase type B catalytic subunit n=1 Tax=Diplogelasinospora grovesii TaxID=303347 RepID=A0AAN6S7N1_9PEZI|nr:acyl-CoA N-acyltransferase [Diplogelasinospora grovesii]